MQKNKEKTMGEFRLEADDFQTILDALHEDGYEVVGPTLEDQAIVYDKISSVEDLPIGWGDEQAPGEYRLRKRDDRALFGYNLGPQSWKKYLHPPKVRLFQAKRSENGFELTKEEREETRYAFLGVRPCELSAIEVQDRVFLGEHFTDPVYQANRQNAFIITTNCSQAAATCFCTSMGSGPSAKSGFDLSLTEVLTESEHYFLMQSGSEAGERILEKLPCTKASAAETEKGEKVIDNTREQMTRRLETDGLKELLYANLEHDRWNDVAERCLNCANCTMVCPTCFCTTVEDVTDLTGDTAERWRRWDSCFTMDFSYIHGGAIRPSAASRYRQWMTHKLASWHDQFETSGCIGCGRCIAWCPVGIDITEEARAIRETDERKK